MIGETDIGLPDLIRCDAALPDKRLKRGTVFQSHSMGYGLERFTITRKGRLIFHRCHYEEDQAMQVKSGLLVPQWKRIPVQDFDLEHHGDIKLFARLPDETLVEYVARFTHGNLDWIRSSGELIDTSRGPEPASDV